MQAMSLNFAFYKHKKKTQALQPVKIKAKAGAIERYQNEINTVNQLQINYSTNVHLLIPRFMVFVNVCENL